MSDPSVSTELELQQRQSEAQQSYRLSFTLAEVERYHILHVLAQHRANIVQAAKHLGISRGALYRRMRDYDIHRDHGIDGDPVLRNPGA